MPLVAAPPLTMPVDVWRWRPLRNPRNGLILASDAALREPEEPRSANRDEHQDLGFVAGAGARGSGRPCASARPDRGRLLEHGEGIAQSRRRQGLPRGLSARR